jgi:hypothetical protein
MLGDVTRARDRACGDDNLASENVGGLVEGDTKVLAEINAKIRAAQDARNEALGGKFRLDIRSLHGHDKQAGERAIFSRDVLAGANTPNQSSSS